MNQHFHAAIVSKLKPNAPYAQNLRTSIDSLYELGVMLDAHKAKIAAANIYSEVGRRAAVADVVKTDLARRFVTASGSIRRSLKAIADRRRDFTVPPLDKGDVVAEMQRAEVRAYLRNLPIEKRTTAAFAIANDPELGAALYHSGPALCGLDEGNFREIHKEAREVFRNKYVEQHFAKPLAELEAAEVDYITGAQIMNAVRGELQAASGLTEPGFEALLQPLQEQADKQS